MLPEKITSSQAVLLSCLTAVSKLVCFLGRCPLTVRGLAGWQLEHHVVSHLDDLTWPSWVQFSCLQPSRQTPYHSSAEAVFMPQTYQKPSQAKPSQAKPSQAKPSQTKPSQATQPNPTQPNQTKTITKTKPKQTEASKQTNTQTNKQTNNNKNNNSSNNNNNNKTKNKQANKQLRHPRKTNQTRKKNNPFYS